MRYLAPYVFRVALPTERLVRFAHDHVTFRYLHAAPHETREQTLPVQHFLARFLQHVLPRGFTKIRSYGLLSPSTRPALDRARHLLEVHATPHAGQQLVETAGGAVGTGIATVPSAMAIPVTIPAAPRCPVCQRGPLRLVARYRRSRAPP